MLGNCPVKRRRARLRQAPPPEEAEQVEFRLALHLVQRLVVGEVLDADDEAFAQGAELLRQARERGIGHALEIGEAGRSGGAPVGRGGGNGGVGHGSVARFACLSG